MNDDRIFYVLGFAFTDDGRVLLIEKKRPEWQAGRLNGVGGRVETTESSCQAMVREFQEETGVETGEGDWHFRGRMYARDWSVFVFSMTSEKVKAAKTKTDERLFFHYLDEIGLIEPRCIENVAALIHLCRIPFSQPSGMWPRFELHYGWKCPDA